MQSTLKNRTLFCRDNLDILRGINSNSIDLIYLDPPFNTKKVFQAPIGTTSEGASFKDIWKMEDTKEEWHGLIAEQNPSLYEYLNGISTIGDKSNKYYLIYMAMRLIEMQRILKDTGSIYLHCDPTMSHFLKLLMDVIFRHENFRNEIVWCYSGGGSPKKDFGKKHDLILRYSKTDQHIFHADSIRIPYNLDTEKYQSPKAWGSHKGIDRLYSPNPKGKVPEDWWTISPINSKAKERMGYPTQKPLALLERIIKASSNEGEIVLDPFCGCASTCIASELLNRQWIGIDVSEKAYELVKQRLIKEVSYDLFKYKNPIIYRKDIPQRTDLAKITFRKPKSNTDCMENKRASVKGVMYSLSIAIWKRITSFPNPKGGEITRATYNSYVLLATESKEIERWNIYSKNSNHSRLRIKELLE